MINVNIKSRRSFISKAAIAAAMTHSHHCLLLARDMKQAIDKTPKRSAPADLKDH